MEEVFKILSNVDPEKASGLDGGLAYGLDNVQNAER